MSTPRSVKAYTGMAFTSAIGATTIVTTGLALLASAQIEGAATIGTSLIVSGPVTATSFSGNGASLTALNASNLTSGSIPVARLGSSGEPNSTRFLRGDNSWSTAVTQVTVTANAGISASVQNQGTTPNLTFSLGAITPTSVASTGNISAATFSTTGLASLGSLTVASTATFAGSVSVSGSLSVAGSLSAPSFVGALVGTGPYAPVLTTGVFAGVNASAPTIPQFGLIATAAPVNARASSFYVANNGTLNWTLLLDNLTTNTSFLTVTRSGVTATNISLIGTAITLSGAVTASSMTTTGNLSVGGGLDVTGLSDLNTLSTTGLATLNQLNVSTSANISEDLVVTGTTQSAVFIPTQTTLPATGIYAPVSGGVGISTGTKKRFEVTPAGLINLSSPLVYTPIPVPAAAIDCSQGNYFTKTYTGSNTWSFTNVPASGNVYRLTLRLIRGASGTQTWPSSVRWTGGSTPTLTNTNGGRDILEFVTEDGGVTWRAYRVATTTT